MDYIRENDFLWELFNKTYRESQIISVVGAGGKTSVVTRLAKELLVRKTKAIVTTTTKMYEPKDWYFIDTPSYKSNVSSLEIEKNLSKIKTSLETNTVIWVGARTLNDKIMMISPEFLKRLVDLRIPIIIEADGAKRLPCKVPAAHEPFIIRETTLVIGVYGIDCVGKPIQQVCHRPELVAKLLEKSLNHVLTCEDLVQLVVSKSGLQKNVEPYMDFYFILNKIHTRLDLELAMKIGELLSQRGFYKFIIM